MKAFFWSLVLMMFAAEIVCVLLDDHGKIKKYVTLVATLILLCVMVSPLKDCMSALRGEDFSVSVEDREGEIISGKANEMVLNETKYLLCENIKTALATKYAIATDTVKVELQVNAADMQNVTIDEIHLQLFSRSDGVLKQKIESYLSDTFCCECTAEVNV